MLRKLLDAFVIVVTVFVLGFACVCLAYTFLSDQEGGLDPWLLIH